MPWSYVGPPLRYSGSADPYWNYVTALFHFNGTNGSTTFTDVSIAKNTPYVLTGVGGTGTMALSTAQAKFGASSILINGPQGTGLLIANGQAAQGRFNWTIEFWFYPTGGLSDICLFSNPSPGFPNDVQMTYDVGIHGVHELRLYNGNTVSWAINILPNQWHHVVVQQTGANWNWWVDGVGYDSAGNGNNPAGGLSFVSNYYSNGGFMLGGLSYGTPNVYFDDLRITTGLARYTPGAPITVPTEPYPDGPSLGPGDPLYAYDTVGFHFDGTNGSTTLTDPFRVVTNVSWDAGQSLTTSNKKFGTASLNLNGAGCVRMQPLPWATGVVNPPWWMDTDDFCVEAWVYCTTPGTKACVYGYGREGATFPYMLSSGILIPADGSVYGYFYYGSIGISAGAIPGSMIYNAWTHLAFTRQAGFLKFFVNGAQQGSSVNAVGLQVNPTVGTYGSDYNLRFGKHIDGDPWYFTGQIDDFRWTMRNSRYTGNFTPPAIPFQESQ